ncbi:intermembrane transport protein PqiB [Azotobacter beijerinckii]|uniref:Paraquat-inducible protein B n=1 Tax=Azotobacter beijerinckii TaxID=170623 RepID=A0A1I4CTY7_9GAMM|nr:MlaD family protein [Azotobacter beijerinckii]SFB24814.1 paraquat-inducible protein B [Azotobacter beijerinckii]SFK83381.1 paraquat-inducible protein B [Azotobacter beijerinckii]
MPDAPPSPDLSTLPEAEAAPKSRWKPQLVWLVPLVAALIGGWLAVKSVLDQGPVITIVFKNAEGLEAGKTKLKYKDVEIGLVTTVALSQDLKQVVATAELVKDFKPHLVEDTTFWLVKPRISGGSVSGLGTVLSGSFIGVGVGKSALAQKAFTALEVPPVIQVDTPGREFVLRSSDLGSLEMGSPIFFRRLQVGQVVSYRLDQDGRGVDLRIFVNAPYDQYVTENTRFWNASGLDVKLDAGGIEVNTQSMLSILLGGVAFETPPESAAGAVAAADTTFELFAGRGQAMRNPERDVLKMVMLFDESLRGLAPGAIVDFRGIALGEVSAIRVELDPVSRRIIMPVEVNLYPQRLRLRSKEKDQPPLSDEARKRFLDNMVANGLRAQMRSGNLLTGQIYIALDFLPDAPKAGIDWNSAPPQLPTTAGSLGELQATLKNVAGKLEKLPVEQIGTDLRQTLQAANRLMTRLDTQVTPEVVATLSEARKAVDTAQGMMAADKPLQYDTREAIRELGRTAKSLRALSDYLERHPEALLWGKQEDKQ